MLWQYRTIIFEFAKDGLLGEKYINDEDMENTLNEQGLMGWEMVSAVPVQEGILTVLKRPVNSGEQQPGSSVGGRSAHAGRQPEVSEQGIRSREREHLAALGKEKQPRSAPQKTPTHHVGDIKIS